MDLFDVIFSTIGDDHFEGEDGPDEESLMLLSQQIEEGEITNEEGFVDALLGAGFDVSSFSAEELANLYAEVEMLMTGDEMESGDDELKENNEGDSTILVDSKEELLGNEDFYLLNEEEDGVGNGVTFGSRPFIYNQSSPSEGSFYGGIAFGGYYVGDNAYYYATTGDVYDDTTGSYLYSYGC